VDKAVTTPLDVQTPPVFVHADNNCIVLPVSMLTEAELNWQPLAPEMVQEPLTVKVPLAEIPPLKKDD